VGFLHTHILALVFNSLLMLQEGAQATSCCPTGCMLESLFDLCAFCIQVWFTFLGSRAQIHSTHCKKGAQIVDWNFASCSTSVPGNSDIEMSSGLRNVGVC
jgi:hypothetical protein